MYFVHAYSFQSDLTITDTEFALSFTGDGYLFTESLFSESHSRFSISVKPFSTEGLVMFAYDEQVGLDNFCYL